MTNDSYKKSYFSFYSTYTGMVTTDPQQMMVPIDDHGFHRGDGVFEAMKWRDGRIWLLESHLSRLQKSCERIALSLPLSLNDLKKKTQETVEISQQTNGLLRIFVTRGPGSFGVSPYESTNPQIYIVATEFKEWSEERVRKGASIMRSSLAPKKGIYAQVKSLNYLPNVLMKKEALDSGFDFAIGVGETGEILESSTENLAFIKEKKLITPLFDSTLRGTSLIRLTELLAGNIDLVWEQRSFLFEELVQADEVLLVGTTLSVQPVTKVENHAHFSIEQTMRLRALLRADQ